MTKQKENEAPADQMTPEEIETKKVKKKHNLSEIFRIEIPTDDEGSDFAIGYLKKPNRHTMGVVMGFMASDKIGQAFDVLLNSCLLKDDSDPRILSDDEIYWGAISSVKELIKVRKGQIKKY